jgi:D-proline reductase (dithiol) PrdB
VPRLETLSEVQRKMLQFFPCMEFETTAWAPLRKDLSQSKMALVTTAGLHLRGDKPFFSDPKIGDQSFRVIPSSTSSADILQSHISIGFDHTAFYRDINIAFPIDRARELVYRGVIDSVSESYYSFMGGLGDVRQIIEDTGPQVAQCLNEEGVDLVFLVPI